MKREFSPSNKTEAEGSTKKPRSEPRNASTALVSSVSAQFVPPVQLRISVLSWQGLQTAISADGNDMSDYVRKYCQAAACTLTLVGWNEAHEAHEYRPAMGLLTFKYKRHAFIGNASSEIAYYGDIICEEMSPQIRVCASGQNPWPERFQDVPGIDRSLSGPPFRFYECDFCWNAVLTPDMLARNSLELGQPDMPGQPDDSSAEFTGDDEVEDMEEDSKEGVGWRGAWVEALLQRKAQQEDLGEREVKTVWNHDESWAVCVQLKAIDLHQDVEILDEKIPAISGYSVEAKVDRIFLRRKYFENSSHPLEEPNEGSKVETKP